MEICKDGAVNAESQLSISLCRCCWAGRWKTGSGSPSASGTPFVGPVLEQPNHHKTLVTSLQRLRADYRDRKTDQHHIHVFRLSTLSLLYNRSSVWYRRCWSFWVSNPLPGLEWGPSHGVSEEATLCCFWVFHQAWCEEIRLSYKVCVHVYQYFSITDFILFFYRFHRSSTTRSMTGELLLLLLDKIYFECRGSKLLWTRHPFS